MTEDLDVRGKAVYEALIANREVSEAQKTMALNAARMADTLDRIETELLNAPLTVRNSQGTITINPLISEARMLTGALAQILAKLGVSALPEVEKRETNKLDDLTDRRNRRAAQRAAASSGS